MKFHHIAFSVKDLSVTADFYVQFFGFEKVREFTKPGWDGKALILRRKELQLELFHFNNQVQRKDNLSDFHVLGFNHLSFEVKSVDKTSKLFKEKGIDIDKPEKGTTCTKFCFLRDPDGIPIELYEA